MKNGHREQTHWNNLRSLHTNDLGKGTNPFSLCNGQLFLLLYNSDSFKHWLCQIKELEHHHMFTAVIIHKECAGKENKIIFTLNKILKLIKILFVFLNHFNCPS